MEQKRYIEAGKIVNTHGVRGEVKIQVWLDSPDFLKTFKTVYIDEKPVKVLGAKVHKGFLITLLEGVKDVNDAMCLKNKDVYIDRKDARLPRGGYFLQDLYGAKVVTEDGTEIGTLAEIMETPATAVYVVKGEQEHLIPAVPEFIRDVNLRKGTVTVHLIEGM